MTIKIGINPLTWTNDDLPSLGADTPLETCLREGKQAGYLGFELGNKFPREANVLGPILQQFQLELVSGWYSGQLLQRHVDDEINALQGHLNLLKALGAEVLVFAEVTGCIHGRQDTPLSHRPVMTDAQWEMFTEKLNQIAAYTLAEGVRLAYHHHMGTVVETESDIDRLMKMTDDTIGLLLDTGHLTYSGGDPLTIIQRYGQRICHVHCKDIRPEILAWAKNSDSSFLNAVLQGVFTVPGDGCIDYSALLNALANKGYEGWLVVEAEQDPAIAHPLTYARKGYEYLEQQATQAGW
ncbi:myo-inosose-2 dehydratase [Zooshikella sp. RANM57]|uniref:myo-inosose-2 dehydratase n=1 Tax=Zooshikella sp. RANM57 TaxID=3425863 RepID=UPI003D6DE2C2